MSFAMRYALAFWTLAVSRMAVTIAVSSSSTLRGERIASAARVVPGTTVVTAPHAGYPPAASVVPAPKVIPSPNVSYQTAPKTWPQPKYHRSVDIVATTQSPMPIPCQWIAERPFRSVRLCFDSKAALVFDKRAGEWYQDYKLWLGIVMWSSMVYLWKSKGGNTGVYAEKAIFTFGMNLLVLHLVQYNPVGMVPKMLFYVFLNCMFFAVAFWGGTSIVDDGEFVSTSKYEDLDAPPIQALCCFVGQAGLMSLYLESLVGIVHGHDNPMSYWYWFIAFFAMQMVAFVGNDYLGSDFPTEEFISLVVNIDQIKLSCTEVEGVDIAGGIVLGTGQSDILREGGVREVKVTKLNVVGRFIFGFFINSICRDVLSYSLPVLLAHFTDPLDFVVYCVACTFITSLDDSSKKVFKVEKKTGFTPRN